MTVSGQFSRPLRVAPGRKRDIRTQFGALCWRMKGDKVQVLLVQTKETRRWVVPKGWPQDGATPEDSAAAEAWEEAGVTGKVRPQTLGIFTYDKRLDGDDLLPCVVAVFPLEVRKTHEDWPEKSERARRWVGRKKAAQMVQEPELARLLKEFDPRKLG